MRRRVLIALEEGAFVSAVAVGGALLVAAALWRVFGGR